VGRQGQKHRRRGGPTIPDVQQLHPGAGGGERGEDDPAAAGPTAAESPPAGRRPCPASLQPHLAAATSATDAPASPRSWASTSRKNWPPKASVRRGSPSPATTATTPPDQSAAQPPRAHPPAGGPPSLPLPRSHTTTRRSAPLPSSASPRAMLPYSSTNRACSPAAGSPSSPSPCSHLASPRLQSRQDNFRNRLRLPVQQAHVGSPRDPIDQEPCVHQTGIGTPSPQLAAGAPGPATRAEAVNARTGAREARRGR